MKLIDALQLPTLRQSRIVAGAENLDQMIRWVPIVDLPNPLPWVRSGDFLLTTGYGWPKDEEKLRDLVIEFSKRGLTGVGLAVPQYFDEMPAIACAVANELQFPLIEIPWEISFNAITEEILSSILTYQYKLQEHSEFIHQEVTRIALEARDLQEIALTFGRLIGRTIVIQHPEGPLLAVYHKEEEAYKGEKAEIFLREFSIFSKEQTKKLSLHSSSQPIRIPSTSGSDTTSYFVCSISIKKELVGLFWIIEGQHPLGEVDLRAAQSASIVMALHISQQRALASLEAQLGYSFLDSLFEGEFITTPQTLRRAELLGFEPEAIYSVGILIMDAPVPLSHEGILKRERLADNLKRIMQEMNIPSVLSLTQNQILFLIPDRIQSEDIWKLIKDSNFSFAVSLPHRGFSNIRQGFKEVSSILPHINFGQIHRYEDLLVPRVLMGDHDARTSFLGKLFDPLRRSKNGDVLIHTLLAFARLGFQLKKTATELNIHPKTLRYRLNRAIAIGNFDLNESETQFHLQLAIHIITLENQRELTNQM
ncbi:PucR family transcriptional regulator ligand-binding domain-containing protein [Paenibacillus sp. FSL K6-0276]|uniref:PucR family transcriptional regulator n=1 Tax=Paenibacillus sp. FSL K6-0276 TaxID=2921450 RepID=UPI0030ED7765